MTKHRQETMFPSLPQWFTQGVIEFLGLTLSLFIEQDEYMDRIASAAGARVVIHDFHFKPLPDEEGFSVAPGYTTAISLQKVYHTKSLL